MSSTKLTASVEVRLGRAVLIGRAGRVVLSVRSVASNTSGTETSGASSDTGGTRTNSVVRGVVVRLSVVTASAA